MYPHGLKEHLIVRLELNSSEKVILYTGHTSPDKRDDFANNNEEFYNPSIKNILVTINGMPHQLFAAGLQARDIYPEIKKHFYKEHPNMTWKKFLTTKCGLHARVLAALFTAAVE